MLKFPRSKRSMLRLPPRSLLPGVVCARYACITPAVLRSPFKVLRAQRRRLPYIDGRMADRRSHSSTAAAAALRPISLDELPDTESTRSHLCGDITPMHADNGEEVTVVGWLQSLRPIGGVMFGVVRDWSGNLQVVCEDPSQQQLRDQVANLPLQSVVRVRGRVRRRPADMVNADMRTGAVEVEMSSVQLLNPARGVMPIEMQGELSGEEARLRHRHLDLRRPEMQRNLRLRSAATLAVRRHLSERGFVEVETPTLFKSTPEGAAEFLVPTRQRGKFYALPQSPQQHKQLLMAGGVDKYFQIARCYRDEGSRADRQPEFTQIDLEQSFVRQHEIMGMVEELVAEVVHESLGFRPATPFPRMSHAEAMASYGVDKPDTRFDLRLRDVSEIVRGCEVPFLEGAESVRAIRLPGAAKLLSRKRLDALVKDAKTACAGAPVRTHTTKIETSKMHTVRIVYMCDS